MQISPILEGIILKEKIIYNTHSIRRHLAKISKGYYCGGMLTAISLEVFQ